MRPAVCCTLQGFIQGRTPLFKGGNDLRGDAGIDILARSASRGSGSVHEISPCRRDCLSGKFHHAAAQPSGLAPLAPLAEHGQSARAQGLDGENGVIP